MERKGLRRTMVPLAFFAALLLLTARKEAIETPAVNVSPATPRMGNDLKQAGTFSQFYDYCGVDGEGRPIVVRRKRHLFLHQDDPWEENDRRFDSALCQ